MAGTKATGTASGEVAGQRRLDEARESGGTSLDAARSTHWSSLNTVAAA
jgi:hypothetical protein